MSTNFADRLLEAVEVKRSCLVVGLDPLLERLPRDLLGAVGAGAPVYVVPVATVPSAAPHVSTASTASAPDATNPVMASPDFA